MSDNKTYRIKANVGNDSVLNVNLNQDYKTFELLSLKVESDNLYKFHTSDYGCVAGRVLANGNFGIPNAKISIFIKATDEDLSDAIISYLYPYKNTRMKNEEGIRYNLLPDSQLSDCHRNVGTFPNKRLVLDDNNVFEVYDKYYKYTTRSNDAGDYMIFGVPVGEQTLHVDIDLSDIGILSQRPRDMVYKGYNVTQFENANMFKSDTDLDTLTQIITQNSNVYVYPFWGEKSEGDIAITRKDIEIQYKFEPTCVFMGSMITDEKSNAISKTCVPSERMGKMDRLTTGSGTIEMIRKKPDGSVEEFIVQGNQLIDGNGVWCYQIPMNLDYVCTDEYGNIVPTDDPKKGIATRARVRFRMSITEHETGAEFSHAAKTLVPNNPQSKEDVDYVFGTNTLDDEFATKSFRDLFWNQVYSVKSYIPRFQQGNYNRNKRFSGIKEVNVNGANNPLPYNNMRVDISFMFTLQCAIFHVLLKIVTFFNKFMSLIDFDKCSIGKVKEAFEAQGVCLFLGDGYCPDLQGWYFAPGCTKNKIYDNTWNKISNSASEDSESVESQNSETEKRCLTRDITYFIQCTEINMAMEYDVIQFDFYNDWVNGVIYSPRWNADIRKKRSYFFNLIRVSPRLNACSEENFSSTRRMVQQCALNYNYDEATSGYTKNATPKGCISGSSRQRCHGAKGRKWVKIFGSNGGVVHRETSMDSSVYYYKPCEWAGKVKRTFFATDIILLGSLNENDGQGIPQTFKKLSPSTYQLPDALASTNIGVEGFLYGASDGGHVCNKKLSSGGVENKKVETNFDNLVEWSKGSEDYEGNPYDSEEKPITETAGIDWGFSGPEQGTNDFDKLYYPGGHFLGISCAFAQTNIKSCINLSRVCELGSTISHRQSYVVANGSNDYKYIYSIPTGLISGDEIVDSSGKNEFATLNYNGLKTRRNVETSLLEYDFKTIFPVNFNGELKNEVSVNNSNYNRSLSGVNFARTIEDGNKDYYKFRMGIKDSDTQDDIRKKYLISNSGSVSMPRYENSFYFYFGISNGNTAIDRFYKDFFAECPTLNPYEPSVKIYTEDANACNIKDGKAEGKIIIELENVDNAACRISGGGYRNTIEYTNIFPKRVFSGLTDTDYSVTVYGDNILAISKNVRIEVAVPASISNISYNVTDFVEGIKYMPTSFGSECNTAITGYVSFSNADSAVALLIANSKFYHFVVGTQATHGLPSFGAKTEVNYGSISGGKNKCYLWNGNDTYDVYAKVSCGTGESVWIKLNSFSVSMPGVYDIIFDGNEEASYLNAIQRYGYVRTTIDSIIDDNRVSDEVRKSFMKSLFFSESKYSVVGNDSIDVTFEGDVVDIDHTVLYGNEDSIEIGDSTVNLICSEQKELDISTLSQIYVPSRFMPSYKEYTLYRWNFSTSTTYPTSPGAYITEWYPAIVTGAPIFNEYKLAGVEKTNYTIYRQLGGRSVSNRFKLNSIYLPFYFRALFLRTKSITNGRNAVSLAVVNAIKTSGTTSLKEVRANGTSIKSSMKFSERSNISTLEEKYDLINESFSIEDMFQVDSTKTPGGVGITLSTSTTAYTISIEDNAGRRIQKTVGSYFIGDEDSDGLRPFVSEANNGIRYYIVKKTLIENNVFDAYYEMPSGGGALRQIVYPEGKKIVSDKDITRVTQNIKNNTIIYENPYFPTWSLGSHYQGPYATFTGGTEYSLWYDWPRIYNTKYGTLDRVFWSTPLILDNDLSNFSYESGGAWWLSEKARENELFGNITYSHTDYCVIGVYDADYHYEVGQRPTNPLHGDKHDSSIVIVRAYTIDEFDEYRRQLGLI